MLRRSKGGVVSEETAWRVGLGTRYKEHSKKRTLLDESKGLLRKLISAPPPVKTLFQNTLKEIRCTQHRLRKMK